jgi:hypothetical protein
LRSFSTKAADILYHKIIPIWNATQTEGDISTKWDAVRRTVSQALGLDK